MRCRATRAESRGKRRTGFYSGPGISVRFCSVLFGFQNRIPSHPFLYWKCTSFASVVAVCPDTSGEVRDIPTSRNATAPEGPRLNGLWRGRVQVVVSGRDDFSQRLGFGIVAVPERLRLRRSSATSASDNGGTPTRCWIGERCRGGKAPEDWRTPKRGRLRTCPEALRRFVHRSVRFA